MQNERVPDKRSEKPDQAEHAAKDDSEQKAEEAGDAKAEELRNTLQTRGEQGKGGLGSVPLDKL